MVGEAATHTETADVTMTAAISKTYFTSATKNMQCAADTRLQHVTTLPLSHAMTVLTPHSDRARAGVTNQTIMRTHGLVFTFRNSAELLYLLIIEILLP